MKEQRKQLVDDRVRQYMYKKVKEKFGDDYWLIEEDVPELIGKYALRELITALSVKLQKIKSSPTSQPDKEG